MFCASSGETTQPHTRREVLGPGPARASVCVGVCVFLHLVHPQQVETLCLITAFLFPGTAPSSRFGRHLPAMSPCVIVTAVVFISLPEHLCFFL